MPFALYAEIMGIVGGHKTLVDQLIDDEGNVDQELLKQFTNKCLRLSTAKFQAISKIYRWCSIALEKAQRAMEQLKANFSVDAMRAALEAEDELSAEDLEELNNSLEDLLGGLDLFGIVTKTSYL